MYDGKLVRSNNQLMNPVSGFAVGHLPEGFGQKLKGIPAFILSGCGVVDCCKCCCVCVRDRWVGRKFTWDDGDDEKEEKFVCCCIPKDWKK